MKKPMPSSLLWILIHAALILLGSLLFANPFVVAHLGAPFAEGVGSGLVATGAAGLFIYLYVRSSEGLSRSMEMFSRGGLPVAGDIADHTLINEGTELSQYLAQIRRSFFSDQRDQRDFSRTEPTSMRSELVRSLVALSKIGRAATCEEIHEATGQTGTAVRKYNTNRALKAVPSLAKRIQSRKDLLRYELTEHGAALIRTLRLLGRLQ